MTHYMKFKRAIYFLIVLLIGFSSCSKTADTTTAAGDCNGTQKSFTNDISPIVQSTCAINSGCHASGSSNGPGALTNYQQVFNARAAIRIVVANGSMPQNGSLSTSQKNSILCWIDNGATNN
jgi:hypothetical protein